MYNASYHLLIVAWGQTLFASNRGAMARLKWKDNVNPRVAIDELEKSGKYPPHVVAKLRRRQAAHENAYEGLIMLGTAVVAGNTAGLSAEWMNGMMGTYFVLRCAYLWCYLNFTDVKKSYLRSVVWWMGNFCFLTTIWKAGSKINA
ncbi:hypothetical protein BCR39DRAFT_543075 [Naematelia encephala]|uniref:Membrane-associated, eicosanoid/glutathione metabolism protein n=1 Tax=Naematelia encephala TaxID=71784 RepID=A0A1Y2AT45_9TREE|nr:hypothetical protein BCR39DRAFT_543075 [Naematelia encephala]